MVTWCNLSRQKFTSPPEYRVNKTTINTTRLYLPNNEKKNTLSMLYEPFYVNYKTSQSAICIGNYGNFCYWCVGWLYGKTCLSWHQLAKVDMSHSTVIQCLTIIHGYPHRPHIISVVLPLFRLIDASKIKMFFFS